ncbi:unnamed protein product [Dovyalis caffra]|uniref:Uncharacterized protein n=1 Tax=Dovyalis caffra TaxID=77055 RepID=A0AAV1S351_9ROSI|nr:unnamed protein product [Dovyalis caffra]
METLFANDVRPLGGKKPELVIASGMDPNPSSFKREGKEEECYRAAGRPEGGNNYSSMVNGGVAIFFSFGPNNKSSPVNVGTGYT